MNFPRGTGTITHKKTLRRRFWEVFSQILRQNLKLSAKNLQKMAIWAKNPYFRPPGGSKSGENEFSGKNRKRHVLTLPKTKFHAKNQKNLSRGFPGKT